MAGTMAAVLRVAHRADDDTMDDAMAYTMAPIAMDDTMDDAMAETMAPIA